MSWVSWYMLVRAALCATINSENSWTRARGIFISRLCVCTVISWFCILFPFCFIRVFKCTLYLDRPAFCQCILLIILAV